MTVPSAFDSDTFHSDQWRIRVPDMGRGAVECREVKHEISCKARAIERRRVSNMKILVLVLVLVPDDADHPSIE